MKLTLPHKLFFFKRELEERERKMNKAEQNYFKGWLNRNGNRERYNKRMKKYMRKYRQKKRGEWDFEKHILKQFQLDYDSNFLRPKIIKERERCELGLCKNEESVLCIHHLKYVESLNDLHLVGDPDNLVLLCSSCHAIVHRNKQLNKRFKERSKFVMIKNKEGRWESISKDKLK